MTKGQEEVESDPTFPKGQDKVGSDPNSPRRKAYVRPIDFRNGRVDMTHGSGGRAMAQLIDELFAAAFDNEWLRQGNDGARVNPPPGRLVVATDCHVITPLFFPGGDIGALSVHGTINDVAVMGATPLWLAAGFVLEEGFPLADLKRIVHSMAAASREAGVPIVTGDTKVVEKGKGDGVFITTTGVGVVADGVDLSGDRARPGDRVIVSGTMGDHGVAIMSLRENLTFETTIESDTAALHGLDRGDAGRGTGPPGDARPDARRARDDAERDRPPVAGRLRDRRGGDPGAGPRSRPRASSSGSTRSTSRTRASWSRSAPPRTPIACWPRCARIRSAVAPRSSAR